MSASVVVYVGPETPGISDQPDVPPLRNQK